MRFFKMIFSKAAVVVLSIILQLVLFFGFVLKLNQYFAVFQIISLLLGLVVFLTIINKDDNPEYKVPWLVIVFIFPIFGTVLYLMYFNNGVTKRFAKKFGEEKQKTANLISECGAEKDKLSNVPAKYLGQIEALKKSSGMSAYTNNKVEYFDSGEKFFSKFLIDLEAAKQYIFLEYFIIEQGKMWDSILEILQRKVKEGVLVKVLYDDIGTMGKLKSSYYKKLRKMGIDAYKFNKFMPILSGIYNNRDHRKIAIIDGVISYTGGINLADEYINETHPFGHWKDTAVRIEGSATKNFVIMFLENFALASKESVDYSTYVNVEVPSHLEPGVVIPFGDGPKPLYMDQVGENAIINIINQAEKYVYISTPYLICGYNLLSALKLAAKRGVEVKIVTPGIPDKKLIWKMTRSNYKTLLKDGVEIYEYTPGFIHSKVILADDEVAIVGTINLDYRSLVHHFECGAYMVNTNCLADIKQDFLSTIKLSEKKNDKNYKLGFLGRFMCSLLKLFSPML